MAMDRPEKGTISGVGTWPARWLFPHSRWGASRMDLARWAGWLCYLTQVYDALLITLFRGRRSVLSSWRLGLMLGDDWMYHIRRGLVGVTDFDRKAILVRPWLVRTRKVGVRLEAVLVHEIVHVLAGVRQNHGRPFLRKLLKVHRDALGSDRLDLAKEIWIDLQLHARRESVQLAEITGSPNERARVAPRDDQPAGGIIAVEHTKRRRTPASRNASSSFEKRWNRGPIQLNFDANVPPEVAHAMMWFIHITSLARTRPLPAHVQADPAILAEPLSRETGWSLRACLQLIERMMSLTARQLRKEEIDLPED